LQTLYSPVSILRALDCLALADSLGLAYWFAFHPRDSPSRKRSLTHAPFHLIEVTRVTLQELLMFRLGYLTLPYMKFEDQPLRILTPPPPASSRVHRLALFHLPMTLLAAENLTFSSIEDFHIRSRTPRRLTPPRNSPTDYKVSAHQAFSYRRFSYLLAVPPLPPLESNAPSLYDRSALEDHLIFVQVSHTLTLGFPRISPFKPIGTYSATFFVNHIFCSFIFANTSIGSNRFKPYHYPVLVVVMTFCVDMQVTPSPPPLDFFSFSSIGQDFVSGSS